MNTENPIVLKKSPVLERLVQPMDESFRTILEEEIIDDPDHVTITVWNDINLFDYEKYDMCHEYSIPFSVRKLDFHDINEAASYTCSAQLKRPDLTGEYRKYLIGQKFHFEEASYRESPTKKTTAKYRIAYKIGEGMNLSGGTVLKYAIYASSIDIL